MNNDLAELTKLNHDYVASVQNSNVKRFDEILAADFYCSNPDKSLVDRTAFLKQTGYPHGRPGYVIDHIKPLACGGADNTSNMQWQTVAAAKMKDRTERASCR